MALIQVSVLICCSVAIQLVTDVQTVKAPTQKNAPLLSEAQNAHPSASDCENFCSSVLSSGGARRLPSDDQQSNNQNNKNKNKKRRKNRKNKKRAIKDGEDENIHGQGRLRKFSEKFNELKNNPHEIKIAIHYFMSKMRSIPTWWDLERYVVLHGFDPLLYSIRGSPSGKHFIVDMPAVPEVEPVWSNVDISSQIVGINQQTYQYLLTSLTIPVTDLDNATKIAMEAALPPPDQKPHLKNFLNLLKIGNPTFDIEEADFTNYLNSYWEGPYGQRSTGANENLSKAKLLDPAQVVETGKRLKAIGNDMLKKLIMLRTYCALIQYDESIPKIGKSIDNGKLLKLNIKANKLTKEKTSIAPSNQPLVAQIVANIRLQSTLYLYSKVPSQDRSIKPMTLDDYGYYISLRNYVEENSIAVYSSVNSEDKYPAPEETIPTLQQDQVILRIQSQAEHDAGVSTIFQKRKRKRRYALVDVDVFLKPTTPWFIIKLNYLRRAWRFNTQTDDPDQLEDFIAARELIKKYDSVLASYGNLVGLAGYGTLGVDLAMDWLKRVYNHSSAAVNDRDIDRSEDALKLEAINLAMLAFNVYAQTQTVDLEDVDDKDKIFFYTYAKENCLNEAAETSTFLSEHPDFQLTYECGPKKPQ